MGSKHEARRPATYTEASGWRLRQLIADSRQHVLRAVDTVQVQTYWHVGQHIVEFEQGGAQRAAYGQRLLPQLGHALAAEFGRGFDATNLRHMRAFYLAFPIRDALRRELSWTHYRLLLRVGSAEARQWYAQEAATHNWSTRALERQIASLRESLVPVFGCSEEIGWSHHQALPTSRGTLIRTSEHPNIRTSEHPNIRTSERRHRRPLTRSRSSSASPGSASENGAFVM